MNTGREKRLPFNSYFRWKSFMKSTSFDPQPITFTAYVEYDPATHLYVGTIPGIPGAHTQGATLDELQVNLKEVLDLCLEEFEGSAEDLPRFIGIQQIEVNA
jgi:predicted RNase H-like HicB family nuclease